MYPFYIFSFLYTLSPTLLNGNVFYFSHSSTDKVNVDVKHMLITEIREGCHGRFTDEEISRKLHLIM